MSKIRKYMLIAIVVLILLAVVIWFSNPLRRFPSQIRSSILKLAPIGTSMEDVIKVIESHEDWKVMYISYEFGYQKPGPTDPADKALGRRTFIGEKSIRALIGEYRIVFEGAVTVYWGFDADGKLIDVAVRKDWDSI